MLYLRTFGSVSLLDAENRVLVSDQRRRLAILALLAVSGESGLSRDKILAFLWPEGATDNARHALHQLLYYLRRDCSHEIFLGTDPLRLNHAVVTSDVTEFTNSIAAGALEQAVTLYKGPFLDGFYVTGAVEFESWVELQRARLHQEYTGALHRLALASDADSAHNDSIGRWRALAAADPLNASVTLGLMRALAAAGDPVGALRQARTYEILVREEVGQMAAPEVIAFADELKARNVPRNGEPARVESAETDSAATSSDIAAPISRSRWSRLKTFATPIVAVVAMLLLIGAYTAVRMRARPGPNTTTIAAPAIAIMPFGVNDPALVTWRNGALVSLAADIDGAAGLRAIDPQAIIAALRLTSDTVPDRSSAIRVAQATGARYAVLGNVVAIGQTVRISAELYEAGNGRRVRQLQAQGHASQMFSLLDDLAVDVMRTMLGREGLKRDVSRVELARRMTTSVPALKAYLEGEDLYQLSRFTEAAEAYERALQFDSTFVLMFSRFVTPYTFASEATPKSIPNPLAHALRMLDRLPPRDQLLVRANEQLTRNNAPAAFALLRQASSEYPDDYEVWYSLGEVALHGGGDLLLGPNRAFEAFSNAVKLNPTFGPPYSHLIGLHLAYRGDTARAREVNATYERIAPDAENRSWGGLELALASANEVERAKALLVLDTLPLAVVAEIARNLRHPRLRPAEERALEVIIARVNDQKPGGHAFAVNAYMALGKLAAAIPATLKHGSCPPVSIYWAYLFGKRDLSVLAQSALQPDAASAFSCGERASFAAGGYAVEQGRRADGAAAHALLAAAARKYEAEHDSLKAQQVRLWSEALRGYDLARAGNIDEGVQVLETVQPRLESNINEVVRWWLGSVLLQHGRPRQARPYFASFWDTNRIVPATYYLARIDEQLGHAAEARDEYARFAYGWRGADAELQPLVAEARARVAALSRKR